MRQVLPRVVLGFIAILFALSLNATGAIARQAMSADDIQRAIIQQSLAEYPGNCPCPYNTDRAGRSCGRRSAYSKPGGYQPICYPDDVTPTMIEKKYRQQHQLPTGEE